MRWKLYSLNFVYNCLKFYQCDSADSLRVALSHSLQSEFLLCCNVGSTSVIGTWQEWSEEMGLCSWGGQTSFQSLHKLHLCVSFLPWISVISHHTSFMWDSSLKWHWSKTFTALLKSNHGYGAYIIKDYD